ncbi:MAG: DNA polymerase III subunit delta' [Burkholderiaceae bacterium]|nr:MAG: DNA polymerase III subunit delta' [Burkholderiaceae bacterium]
MSSIPHFLPWQIAVASAWLEQRDRFAHAWLVHGMAGIGKRRFVQAAAASLLCESPQGGLACGRCAACQWVAGGNHPDLRLIRPDAVAREEGADLQEEAGEQAAPAKKAPSRDIRVEQLRALAPWFNTATHRGGWRVAVLYPSEALNAISANALLKVLEEPPEHTVFLLTVDSPDRILPTLVSRCRRLHLPVPAAAASAAWLGEQGLDDSAQWLAAAGGAPLRALQMSSTGGHACPDWLSQLVRAMAQDAVPDVGSVADSLEKEPALTWIDALQRLFLDLSLAAARAPLRYFPALSEPISVVGRRASPTSLSDTGKWLLAQRAVADHPLNTKLFTYSALLRAVQACQPQQ